MQQRSEWSLNRQLLTMLIGMMLGLVIYGVFSVIQLRAHILAEKQQQLQTLVQTAMGEVKQQYALYQAGKLTLAQAQKQAKDNLRKSRYGDNRDYYFIYDFSGTNLMHGAKPEREGKNFYATVDPTGKPYIKQWIALLQQNHQAYIDYLFPKPGGTTPVPKLSYAMEFAPWGWWLGTGIYIDDIDQVVLSSTLQSLAFLLAIGLAVAGLSLAIIRRVRRQIGGEPKTAVHIVERFASGDLRVDIAADSRLSGNVLGSLATMQTRLGGIVGAIRDDIERLSSQAGELSTYSNDVSLASRQQADLSSEMAHAITQMTASVHAVSGIARHTEENAQRTETLAREGHEVVQQVSQEVETIVTEVTRSSERIQTLVERSKEIGSITSSINDIADQTNLLALNAAIEAARAGESGRGFAVVADEVRRLAERTSEATTEISRMIEAIQHDTQLAVQAMADTLPRVQHSQTLAHEATEVLQQIQRQAGDSREQALSVANASQEQVGAANDIAGHVARIANMAEDTESTARHNAESAGKVKTLSDTLRQAVSYFQV
ncbi:MAG: methyl-accepting chemotaxis protein [Paludibacterium sp.]|uniref:methyl-accepting chemotaxis protein n=1 Tax=Paludibacterium sp. TaxID=1917523 RepID=UPI0025F9E14E|nr:methyl-accepting chemotaxis protein [Paludibacterium sp.]MBV8048364.1 methyl-accepting chemotaxis protein [Paludibacterium sp.]